MKTMEEMIKELPPDLKQEVQDFVEFLLEKKVKTAMTEKKKKTPEMVLGET